MLEDLLEVVVTHFGQEEDVLARYGFNGLAEHAGKHRELIARAQDIYRRAVTQSLPMVDVLSFLTRDVVAQHMMLDDHGFSWFLKEIQSQRTESRA